MMAIAADFRETTQNGAGGGGKTPPGSDYQPGGYRSGGYQQGSSRPMGLILTVAVHVVIIGGLLLIPAQKVMERFSDPIETYNVTENVPEPEPLPPPPEPETQQAIDRPFTPPVHVPKSIIAPPVTPPSISTTLDIPTPKLPPLAGSGASSAPPVKADPVFADPVIDPRYRRQFQPPYPSSEMRQGIEGKVRIRVLVGPDGRVRKVEQVSASAPAFWQVTERQALSKWRFKPGTKDGSPVERWVTLTVAFNIE